MILSRKMKNWSSRTVLEWKQRKLYVEMAQHEAGKTKYKSKEEDKKNKKEHQCRILPILVPALPSLPIECLHKYLQISIQPSLATSSASSTYVTCMYTLAFPRPSAFFLNIFPKYRLWALLISAWCC
ncbi:unnamed protein product [Lactuca virosa]|uniref:Uncharacterized protein n=1 Tax=Lactuca virosa TaxID=75947 RepID=A0AAU9NFF4_9ASTR|nr:unnamed protein product [Lactuca virosa]